MAGPAKRSAKPVRWLPILLAGAVLLLGMFTVIIVGILRAISAPATPTPQNESTSAPTAFPFQTAILDLTQGPATEAPPAVTEVPAGDRAVSPVDGMTLVCVPAGEFLMGLSPADQQSLFSMCPGCVGDEFQDAPQKRVMLSEFWIDQTEVTLGQFSQFVYATGYRTTAETRGEAYLLDTASNSVQLTSGADWMHPQGSPIDMPAFRDYPVMQVSWEDARAYCAWAGRRLPTEAEWEKAARGTDGRWFPWGNDMPKASLLNFNLAFTGPVPVGKYSSGASPYGAQDMAGNLWEWVNDYYEGGYYDRMPLVDPPGPESGSWRVRRGGSWAVLQQSELVLVSPSFRYSNSSTVSSDLIGFRCASSARP
jgi:formylglycine-generating enzyme required for sulfatase activity